VQVQNVDSVLKINLLKNYCLNLYGREMLRLQHSAIENVVKHDVGRPVGPDPETECATGPRGATAARSDSN